MLLIVLCNIHILLWAFVMSFVLVAVEIIQFLLDGLWPPFFYNGEHILVVFSIVICRESWWWEHDCRDEILLSKVSWIQLENLWNEVHIVLKSSNFMREEQWFQSFGERNGLSIQLELESPIKVGWGLLIVVDFSGW